MDIQVTYSMESKEVTSSIEDAIFQSVSELQGQVDEEIKVGFSADFTPPLTNTDFFIFVLTDNLGPSIKAPVVGDISLVEYWLERAKEHERAKVLVYGILNVAKAKKSRKQIEILISENLTGFIHYICEDLTEMSSRLSADMLRIGSYAQLQAIDQGTVIMSIQEYVNQQLGKHRLSKEFKNQFTFVPLEILLNGAVLQRQKGLIRRTELYELTGLTRIENIQFVLNEMKIHNLFSIFNDEILVFSDETMKAISNAFDSPEFFYNIEKPLPFLKYKGELTGWGFLEYSFKLASEVADLDDIQASHSFTNILGLSLQGVIEGSRFEFPYRSKHENVGLMIGPNESWYFLLIGLSINRASIIDDIKNCVWYTTPVKDYLYTDRNLTQLKTLMVGPMIDDDDARRSLKEDFKNYHFMWSNVFMRILHQLNTDKELIPIASKYWMSLFEMPLISMPVFISSLQDKSDSSK